MDLRLYDTLTREKRLFQPLDPARVRMYVCGPTVYDFAHIGNARPVIVFDVLFRLLRYLAKQGVWDGGKGETTVTYVRNITDVDDKINARAAERGVAIRELTEETYQNFKQDVKALGCLPPTHEPRATEYVRRTDGQLDMVRLIERLVRLDHAYAAEGHVLFHVPSMPDYGQLSRRSLDEMLAGARVEIAPYKRNPMDFVLWKPSDESKTNYSLPKWQSPCDIDTPGRPGWHIECSAMSGALLGEMFDIHGGGLDLIFPHHENEIAQSRCAFHTNLMACYWMHNGFLQVEGEKMSKSLGNFVTIRELLEEFAGPAVRLAMMLTHYHQPLNWTRERLIEARAELSQWASVISHTAFEHVRQAIQAGTLEPDEVVLRALMDDLNTSAAIARLRELYTLTRQHGKFDVSLFSSCCFLGLLTPGNFGAFSPGAATGSTILVRYKSIIENLKIARINGFHHKEQEAVEFLRKYGVDASFRIDGYPILSVQEKSDVIDDLIVARNAARKRRDFKEADRIRDELGAMGVELEDKKDGTTVPKIKP
jgi:cysteinyl-tRNA synthetase